MSFDPTDTNNNGDSRKHNKNIDKGRQLSSMEGITIVNVQDRKYRVPSASLLASRAATSLPNTSNKDTGSVDTASTIYTEEIITYYHPVHHTYHGLLIGKGGSTLKRMKLETGSRIDIMNGKDLVMIKGTQDKVDHAIKVIDDFLQQAFERAKPTHFLSFPTMSTYTTRKLADFYKSISSSTFHCPGLENDMLIPSGKLHITLGIFKLLSQPDIEETVAFLKNDIPAIISDIIGDKEQVLSIRLKHLAIMQDNPRKTQVLYIQAQDETKNKILDKLCVAIRTKMIDAGYMQKEDRPLKIHITLIKTKNKKLDNGEEERATFDASPILKSHGDLDLGVVHLDKLHLMKMTPTGPGGLYISEGSITV
ncbi:AKAP7 2'5' RNA ligase-like domain-containing protein [Chlamydoabsidia padenii]|nr:AKAP7 2'5' RNA ligase-like domain-containing protein [Chlamydoabsidia padenii]